MATEEILSDIGAIYKRLFNHRPVIQNEVHFFVQEFENKQGEEDLRSLQVCMRLANEIDSIYLEEMREAVPHFVSIREKMEEISELASDILQEERSDLGVPPEERERMTVSLEECRRQLLEEQEVFDEEISREKERLKEEIRTIRENRSRMRNASLGSSITLSVSSASQLAPSPQSDSEQHDGGSPENESTSEEELIHS